ncbi:MAG TPA: hypothetical protein VFU74_20790 [Actinocrinis sp.]|nr:hypothetical protein [Actinocrinis sp.]
MSEAYRRSEGYRDDEPWAQGSEPRRPTRQLGIDPGQAAEFRRRLDYQGSAELIPTAGPDAASDQGPAIKAVWEPEPAHAAATGPGARRRERRTPGRASQSAAGQARAKAARRKKRSVVLGGATAAAVAVGAIGFMTFQGGGDSTAKGGAANVIPVSSPGATSTDRANGVIGTSLSVTASPSRSATPSHSPTPSATQSKAATGTASASATRSASPSPTPRTSSTRTCFLIFCG